jgi:hypothetical protein
MTVHVGSHLGSHQRSPGTRLLRVEQKIELTQARSSTRVPGDRAGQGRRCSRPCGFYLSSKTRSEDAHQRRRGTVGGRAQTPASTRRLTQQGTRSSPQHVAMARQLGEQHRRAQQRGLPIWLPVATTSRSGSGGDPSGEKLGCQATACAGQVRPQGGALRASRCSRELVLLVHSPLRKPCHVAGDWEEPGHAGGPRQRYEHEVPRMIFNQDLQ